MGVLEVLPHCAQTKTRLVLFGAAKSATSGSSSRRDDASVLEVTSHRPRRRFIFRSVVEDVDGNLLGKRWG